MSYKKLLVHSCDIYKAETETIQHGYGSPDEEVIRYPDLPTYSNVPCYFSHDVDADKITRTEGITNVEQKFQVQFLPNVDINFNDKIMWGTILLQLGIPFLVRNHHYEVTAMKVDRL